MKLNHTKVNSNGELYTYRWNIPDDLTASLIVSLGLTTRTRDQAHHFTRKTEALKNLNLINKRDHEFVWMVKTEEATNLVPVWKSKLRIVLSYKKRVDRNYEVIMIWVSEKDLRWDKKRCLCLLVAYPFIEKRPILLYPSFFVWFFLVFIFFFFFLLTCGNKLLVYGRDVCWSAKIYSFLFHFSKYKKLIVRRVIWMWITKKKKVMQKNILFFKRTPVRNLHSYLINVKVRK